MKPAVECLIVVSGLTVFGVGVVFDINTVIIFGALMFAAPQLLREKP